jgi:hypothetical protein
MSYRHTALYVFIYIFVYIYIHIGPGGLVIVRIWVSASPTEVFFVVVVIVSDYFPSIVQI